MNASSADRPTSASALDPGARIVRRLAAAEGYLELDLPRHALSELDRIADAGAFEAIAQLLRGEALQAENRLDEAISALNRAAELFPSPFNQRAWIGLCHCYHAQGRDDLAQQAASHVNPENLVPGEAVAVVMAPIFRVEEAQKPRKAKTPRRRRPPKKG